MRSASLDIRRKTVRDSIRHTKFKLACSPSEDVKAELVKRLAHLEQWYKELDHEKELAYEHNQD